MAPLKAIQGNISPTMCCSTSCREDVLPVVGSKGDGSTYGADATVIIKAIIIIMHSTAGCRGRFTPTMHSGQIGIRLHSYHNWAATDRSL